MDDEPHANKGYMVMTQILLAGHENCGCQRSTHPEVVKWFLPHTDAEHGVFPMRCERQDHEMTRLREQLPSVRPGWIIEISGAPSYEGLYPKY